ncbi:MAG: hypothetical protein C0631_04010 [Sedimenticola sp.]|jgi:hypothetical protein|nr:MAG: hypothetical protein C0631_04010 [Sedimenticola sp.]
MTNPTIDHFDHPLFHHKDLILITPAMEKLKNDLLQLLWNDGTGALAYGMSRVGKTRALEIMTPQLTTRAGLPIPHYYVMISQRDQKTIASIHRNICINYGLRETNRDRADYLANRFVHFIAERADECGCEEALLIVDEFQRLNLFQLDAFEELQDKCLTLDINLVVLFVGIDPECWPLVEQIEKPRNAHIRGRFFTEGIEFKGLTSQADVEACLSEYDRLHFPNEGVSYAEFFTEKGWKLKSLSRDLWRVYREDFKTTYKINSWPMKYFVTTVKILLTDFLYQHGVNACCDEMLRGAIDASKLIPSLTKQ